MRKYCSVLYDGYYPCFPCLHHPLESELPASVEESAAVDDDNGGIGIFEFFQGKNIFITGATGLLGKAYVNGRKEGLILEKPLIMGENGRKVEIDDDDEMSSSSSSCCSFSRVDLADEISLAMKSLSWQGASHHQDYHVTKNLKRLGLERADIFGWYNTYHLTKAMCEMVLNEIRGDVPVLIIRPSVIESSYKEPFPGWIQGNRMFDPVIISYGKGQLPAFLADPQVNMDIIPIDMVVNSTIAAIAKHGIVHKPELNVYHVASGVVNPLRFYEFFEILHDYFSSTPLSKIKNISKIKYFTSFDDFSEYTRDVISKCNEMGDGAADQIDGKMLQKLGKQSKKAKVAYAEQLCKMYKFLGFFEGRFDTGNTQKLLKEMSKVEQLNFEVDATNIDWRKYLLEIHIPGLRKHVLNNTRTSE
ncbi:UNVERIFIED_CONTAM: Fatty acyl-CoA reductase 2 [Sesamum angustifolium]|uniref:Fatty acyl-CoA reductase n=1 Tax=Sesamum angustifolium TaxID=2727405 RepID=A0AAW2PSI5_9LAMI